MAEEDFQEEGLQEIPQEDVIEGIDADNEKDFLKGIKKKNDGFLVGGLILLEREIIAKNILEKIETSRKKHDELADDIDEADEVYRMERKEVPGSDGEMPNYRSPLSTVALEVMHANIMNVFFSPKEIMRVLPTEEGDVKKVGKLTTFGNWSADNELDIFNQIDKLFHNSAKIGETPYIVHWVKEYGTEIKREVVQDPNNPGEPLYDPDTKEAVFEEVEEQKLLYNGPRLEVFSRKDYFQPINAVMGKIPEWEARRILLTYDQFERQELQGKMYKGSIKEIMDWDSHPDIQKEDFEGEPITTGTWEQEFFEFYGRLRVKVIVRGDENESDKWNELEDEFIAIVHKESGTLCALRKNKFPLKKRPIGIDYFIPDDEGRRVGIGMMKFLESEQKAYDSLYNQYIQSVIQANSPFGFFTPFGNKRDEPIKIKHGYLYPTSDGNSIQIEKFPGPDSSIADALERITQWSQLLFGISDFTSGIESRVDPTGPAKKAEIVVAQGNVRMNLIIKRKLRTLQDIFERWFLLYKANMPPNKFMRIVGDSNDNPFKFQNVTIQDFALNAIPDFELTGNVLNANKTLEAQKALSIYQVLVQNPLFNPQMQSGLQALHQLTKWLMDKMDESGISRFLPQIPVDNLLTPEEENARMLQGDVVEPKEGEDFIDHIKKHQLYLLDPTVPDEIKEALATHIEKTAGMLRDLITQQQVIQQAGVQPQEIAGGQNAVTGGAGPGAQGAPEGVFQGAQAGVA